MAEDNNEELAVLYRNNDSVLPVIDLFEKNGISYRLKENDGVFFSVNTVMDILNILLFAFTPHDASLFAEFYYKVGIKIKKEAVMRSLLKDVAWLMANKGTRQCIDRLCELFIGEKPIILERSMMSRYLRYSETEVYNNLYGDNPYDVTLLIESKVELTTRRQLLHLLEQFKPVRCRIAVVFLENTGVLDSYNYLDRNACVFTSSVADLDEEQLMDGTVVIQ